MNIIYTNKKEFTQQQIQDLFLSVGWVSANYPSGLYKALMYSSTVITAWEGERLVGLARVLDDSELVAFMHYVLVHPDYQGHGVARSMIQIIKEKYKDFLYLDIMPEESRNVDFYQKFGFSVMKDGVAMQICNYNNQQ